MASPGREVADRTSMHNPASTGARQQNDFIMHAARYNEAARHSTSAKRRNFVTPTLGSRGSRFKIVAPGDPPS